MERSLRIEAFRNIGFKDEKSRYERLVLNNSLKKGELGDLRIVIGANNAGKSNVLNALEIFGNKNISERDVTDLPFDDENCKKPCLTLFSRDDGAKEDEFALKKQFNAAPLVTVPKTDEQPYKYLYATPQTILSDLEELSQRESDYLDSDSFEQLWNKLWNKCTDDGKQSTKDVSEENFRSITKECFDILTAYKTAQEECSWIYSSNWNNFFNTIRNIDIVKEFENFSAPKKSNETDVLNSTYSQKYGYNFLPKIFVYTEKELSNNDLETDYESLEQDSFFCAVFNSIGADVSEILKAHKDFSTKRNMGILQRLTRKLNEKLEQVSEKFNKLYYLENAPYSFAIDLQESNIFFYLFRGDNTIYLDYQSAGFKWFFNIFFNLLNANDLNAGDIIIMDEPATHLHRDGRKELRALFKEFAIRNDILIVIATHEDALIDMDYLDEIRIVISEDNVSRIVNNFAAVDPSISDTLLPIRKILTVENHILVNPDETVIFVEGITDYNYLTAFKKLFEIQGITFLPVNGIGKEIEDCKKISAELIKIRKHNPILLVDNDNAGQQMKKTNTDSALTVIGLDDIDKDFKTIESLFSKDDLQNFSLLDENGKFVKHASTSTVFKNLILKNKDSISDTTKANFRKVFNRLKSESD